MKANFKAGQIVNVTHILTEHGFFIGENIVLLENTDTERREWRAEGENLDYWWITETEFEPINI